MIKYWLFEKVQHHSSTDQWLVGKESRPCKEFRSVFEKFIVMSSYKIGSDTVAKTL